MPGCPGIETRNTPLSLNLVKTKDKEDNQQDGSLQMHTQ